MRVDDWDVIARLVEEASLLGPSERSKYIAENTTDPRLHDEVMQLLESATEADFLLEEPVQLPAGEIMDPWLGMHAGNCKLIRLLGEGGMGIVYEAIRTLELPGEDASRPSPEQRVAVKIWNRGSLNVQEMRREAALLARVEHPGIARLLDTGQMPDGQPFLVMELVEGEPLVQYAAGKTEGQKLHLISEICHAVEASHRALVAHRDIKPSNILVTRDGIPKLIDFGISKSIEDAGQTMDLRLTPRYASPEQLKGEPITTATDIYSLGVVMYELLTGRTPFPELTGPALAIAICEAAVPQPELSRDLSSIVLKAMSRRPEDRYPSALALKEDLDRYRRGEAVSAIEATWHYRAKKYLWRNGFALAVSAAVLVLIGAGFGQAFWEARQAARRFDQVRGLARSLLFEIHDEVSKVPGTLESRKLILQRALEYLDELAKDQSAEDSLQKDLAESYLKVGQVQGSLVRSAESLGRFQDARGSYNKAVTILERLYARNPGNSKLRVMLAKAIDGKASACTSLRDTACAVPAYERALQLYEQDAKLNASDAMAQARWLTARIAVLDPLVESKQLEKLRDKLREVAGEFEKLQKKYPDHNSTRAFIAYSFKRLGAVEGVLKNYDSAVDWYTKARQIHKLQAERMGESTCDVDIAWVRERQKNWEEAYAALDRALAIRRDLAEGRGADQPTKLALISVLVRKARLLQVQSRWGEARPLLAEADRILQPLQKVASQNHQINDMMAMLYTQQIENLLNAGAKAQAKSIYEKLRLLGPKAISPDGDLRIRRQLGLSA